MRRRSRVTFGEAAANVSGARDARARRPLVRGIHSLTRDGEKRRTIRARLRVRRRFVAQLPRRLARNRDFRNSRRCEPISAAARRERIFCTRTCSERARGPSKGSAYRSRRAKAFNSRARESCWDHLRLISSRTFLISYLKHATTCRNSAPGCHRRQRRCRTPIRQSGDDLSPMAGAEHRKRRARDQLRQCATGRRVVMVYRFVRRFQDFPDVVTRLLTFNQ